MSPTLSASPVGTFGSLISLAASDIVMSIILASVFWRRRSVFPTVNRVLRLVILYSMETALITSVGATAGVVMFAAIPSLPVFTAVLWILPNLILSSLFVALNARQGLRAQNVIIMSPIQRSHETEVSCISHS
ncbi:uncharacterized protein C8Q71DRAFT_455826 [Rhodofomes roseus]|uniref:DUF6534 domain-containing protein n=1 Tax=Rhodofomes roseus TaxID=34475 RepID=A0ABQ8JY62_9APHY|nr:uncharacterized protein C8Q71DRAFT_455826 [Rhodofomes roseus]KAH9828797.1 hypothetical protein C8Q71DRAFT_455826 [Rhodofomes roseus]